MPVADFLDTNVIIYAYSADRAKKTVALNLLSGSPTISTQVLNETVSVFRRKNFMADAAISMAIDDLSAWCRVIRIDVGTIKRALDLTSRYQFSYYDALIASSAIEAGCAILYSEDMQHGQTIDGTLKIANPFLSAIPRTL
jgi:predicted nucleic acid-binding protein